MAEGKAGKRLGWSKDETQEGTIMFRLRSPLDRPAAGPSQLRIAIR